LQPIPIIFNWEGFRAELARLDVTRGRDFSLGVEMGFSEYRNPAGVIMREKTLDIHNNKGIRNNLVAAGIEYGELLAQQAVESPRINGVSPFLFQLEARQAYLALAEI